MKIFYEADYEAYQKIMMLYTAITDGENTLVIQIGDKADNTTVAYRYFNITLSGILEPEPPVLHIGLERIDGNNQEGLVGRCASDTLVTRAYDIDRGRPLEGIPLLFEVITSGLLVAQEGYSTITNQNGEAGVHYHFGTQEGTNSVKVSVLGDETVTPTEFASLIGHLPEIITDTEPSILKIQTYGFDGFDNVFKFQVAHEGTGIKDVEVRASILKGDSIADDCVMLPSGQITDDDGFVSFGLSFVKLITEMPSTYYIKFCLPEFCESDGQPVTKEYSFDVYYDNNEYPINTYLYLQDDSGYGYSGYAQIGAANLTLSKTLIAYINDYTTETPVVFTAKVGGGLVNGLNSVSITPTIIEGYQAKAEVTYTFGSTNTPQIIEAMYAHTNPDKTEKVYFVAGPPEMLIVRRSVAEDNTTEPYIEDEQIFPVAIHDEDGILLTSAPESNETFMQYKTAIQDPQPATITRLLENFDECGKQISSTGYASPSQNIELQYITSTLRYAIYCSAPIVVATETPPDGIIITDPITALASGQVVIQGRPLGSLFAHGSGDKDRIISFEIDTAKYPNILYPDGVATTTLTAIIDAYRPVTVEFLVVGTNNGSIESSKTADKGMDMHVKAIYTSPNAPITATITVTAKLKNGTDKETPAQIYLYKGYNFSHIISNTQFANIPTNLNSAQKIEDWLSTPHHPKSNPTIVSCLAGMEYGGKLISQIIWDACQQNFQYKGSQTTPKYKLSITLNPAVVLTQLQKEKQLISTDAENVITQTQLNKAMGIGKTSNVKDQIEYGVDRLKRWYQWGSNLKEIPIPYFLAKGKNEGDSINYQFKDDTQNTADGRVQVSIRITNKTTFSLYKYTPYINHQKVNDGGNYLFYDLWQQYGFGQ